MYPFYLSIINYVPPAIPLALVIITLTTYTAAAIKTLQVPLRTPVSEPLVYL